VEDDMKPLEKIIQNSVLIVGLGVVVYACYKEFKANWKEQDSVDEYIERIRRNQRT
jgi:hypothetical protein